MIPLMKNTFINEVETTSKLAEFIQHSKRLSMGEQCARFEKEFAKFQGRKHAILFNSGGSANLALLQSLKNLAYLIEGDKIAFSGLTWATNVMPIIQMGLVPVAVDCTPETLNSMSHDLQKTIEKKTIKAFFGTNALGFAGDLDIIKDLCQQKDILFLEDNCEALGTELNGWKTGNFGFAATFSFFVAHHMSTIEGGMICTDDDDLEEMLKIVRANGWDRNLQAHQQIKWRRKHNINSEFEAKYTFYDLGFNFRPTEITGFLGLEQLKYLEENIKTRGENFLFVDNRVQNNPDLITLNHSHIDKLSPFSMPIICRNKELKRHYLSQFAGAGIEVRPMIAGNIQKQPFYQKYVHDIPDLPGTDFLHDCSFYCGDYPELTESDLETIASSLTKY